MQRRAFAMIEMLVVIGVIGAATALTIPLYREYQIRSDLDNAAQLATQGLARAKLLSQLGERDAQWGFYVPAGTLYKGASYAARDVQFDEIFPMPSTIAVQGLFDVAFSRVKGMPNATGDIILKALNNDQRIIQVTIAVDSQTLAANEGNTLSVCHNISGGGGGVTINIPEATWPTHQAHGDIMGACGAASSAGGAASSSVASSVQASSSSAAAVASSSAASSTAGTAYTGCSNKFTLETDQTISVNAAASVTFINMLAQITFGPGGPDVPVHVCYTTNGGNSLSPLFGGNGNCTGNGNSFGNSVDPDGTDTSTKSISAGADLAMKIVGRYKQNGWLAFFEYFFSNDSDGHVLALRNGSMLSSYPSFGNQTPLKNYLVSQGKADATGQITIGACEVLFVTELGTLNSSSSDYQDDVLLVRFN